MIDVTSYNIYQRVTKNVYGEFGLLVHKKGSIVRCIKDMRTHWLARPKDTDETPRMLPKDDCEMIE